MATKSNAPSVPSGIPSQVEKFTLRDWNDVYAKLTAPQQEGLMKAILAKLEEKKQTRLQTKKRKFESSDDNENSNSNTNKNTNKNTNSKDEEKDDQPLAKKQRLMSNIENKNDSNTIETLCKELMCSAEKDKIIKIVVGGIIFNNKNECLVLQRASNEFMPNIYEIASGTKEKTDLTLIECLKREVTEETGLIMKNIIGFIDSFDYKSSSGKSTRQFTFLITVNKYDKITISEEHQNYAWIKKNDIFECEDENNKYNDIVEKITPQVRKLIRKAYKMQIGDQSQQQQEEEELQDIDVLGDPKTQNKTK